LHGGVDCAGGHFFAGVSGVVVGVGKDVFAVL
jgi:hypothetical protein